MGTRPLLTQESPVAKDWQEKFMSLKDGDIKIQEFSPTGFHSSAVNNRFLQNMFARLDTEMPFASEKTEDLSEMLKNNVFVSLDDAKRAAEYIQSGRTEIQKTPDDTIVFVTGEELEQIKTTRANCIGCISHCRFSGFSQYTENGTTGKLPDPRSFCIADSLTKISHGGDIEDGMLFSGSNGYKFATDPLFKDGKLPTTAELIESLKQDLA